MRSGAGRLWSRRAAGFLLHTFLSPPKEKCERPLGRPVPIRAGVGASGPPTGESLCGASRGLSSGQTIGAVRTAVRPACCLPELRVANRLRRLYPLDTRFPSFPPAPLRIASEVNEYPMKVISPSLMPESARQTLPGAGVCACGRTKGLSSGQTIGAVRTAVRSACCLPELRVANRLRRLCPLGDGELFKFNLKSSVCQRQTGLPKGNPPCVFPSFPFGNLRSPLEAIERPIGLQALFPRRSRRINPH